MAGGGSGSQGERLRGGRRPAARSRSKLCSWGLGSPHPSARLPHSGQGDRGHELHRAPRVRGGTARVPRRGQSKDGASGGAHDPKTQVLDHSASDVQGRAHLLSPRSPLPRCIWSASAPSTPAAPWGPLLAGPPTLLTASWLHPEALWPGTVPPLLWAPPWSPAPPACPVPLPAVGGPEPVAGSHGEHRAQAPGGGRLASRVRAVGRGPARALGHTPGPMTPEVS